MSRCTARVWDVNERQFLDRLACGNHRDVVPLGDSGDDQLRDRNCSVLPALGQRAMHVEGSVPDLVRCSEPFQAA